ncbi:hypothetical protein HDV01_007698 [Terramyces sp. JEL0728]|nr:hypothetical protein HDV01_007698 [Terramyces sp. JEL0728]
MESARRYHQKVYSPPSQFITNSNADTADPLNFMAAQLHVDKSELVESSSYTDILQHIYYSHLVDGRIVENHHASIQLATTKVIAYSYNFQGKQNISRCLKFQEGLVTKTEGELGMTIQGDTSDTYVDVGSSLVPTLSFQLQKNEDQVRVSVDQCTGEMVQLLNLVQSIN